MCVLEEEEEDKEVIYCVRCEKVGSYQPERSYFRSEGRGGTNLTTHRSQVHYITWTDMHHTHTYTQYMHTRWNSKKDPRLPWVRFAAHTTHNLYTGT